jgi:integrase
MGRLAGELQRLYPGAEAAEEPVFVIATAHGSTRDDRTIRRCFLRPAAERLGIYWPGFGFHSLRREAVTAIAAGAGAFQAMRAAGHSKADTTLLYVLSDYGEQERAIRRAQEAVLGSE